MLKLMHPRFSNILENHEINLISAFRRKLENKLRHSPYLVVRLVKAWKLKGHENKELDRIMAKLEKAIKESKERQQSI